MSSENSSIDGSLEALIDLFVKVTPSINRPEQMTEASALATSIARDALGSPARYRSSLPGILRWNTQIFTLQLSLDSQPFRENLDSYIRLVEHCIVSISRLSDPAMWSDWPVLKSDSDRFTISSYEDSMKTSAKDVISVELALIVLMEVLPQISSLISDVDRYNVLMGQVVSGILLPVTKGSIR